MIPPQARFIPSSGPKLAHADIRKFARELGAAFEAFDVAAGDRVVTLLPQGEMQFLTTLISAHWTITAPLATGTPMVDVLRQLEQTRPKLAIVDAALPRDHMQLFLQNGVNLLVIGADRQVQAMRADSTLPPPPRQTGNAALTGVLLPTSGTSGEPKRVLLGIERLGTVAGRIAHSLQLQADDRYLCVMPCQYIHGFSTALAAAQSGGTVVFADSFQADTTLRNIQAQRISWLSAAPTHYRSLLTACEKAAPPPGHSHLRLLRSASAPMDRALVECLSARFRVPVIQAYGMTEAGPLIATNTLEMGGDKPGSVGRPCGVTVSIGQPGVADSAPPDNEIWIRGDTVTTDYWSLDTPTATGMEKEPRWLQTGDIGHIDSQGFLFLTGRLRELINAGGEKLLPATIEAVLLQHPAVSDAVVYPAPHSSLGEAPHAAVVLAAGSADATTALQEPLAAAEDVRQFCVKHLPRSHVPHRVTLCDQIPGNLGGKIQRQDLHAYFSGLEKASSAGATPGPGGSNLQASIIECWRRVLRAQTITARDNFFSLGGDSLSAVALATEIENTFGLKVDEAFVFQWPMAEQQTQEMAARLNDGEHARRAQTTAPPLTETSARPGEIAPLSPGQKRLWLLDQLGAGAAYTMCAPVWIDGAVDRARLQDALSEVVARHSALRTRIRILDGQPVQYIEPLVVPVMEFHDVRGAGAGEERALHVAKAERAHVFKLPGFVPVRYRLLQLEDSRYAFILTIHHILCDGWSVPLFYRDLVAQYERNSETGAKELPALERQFADYCCLQQAVLDSKARQTQLNWWKAALHDATRQLPLLAPRPTQPSAAMRMVQQPFRVGAETTGRLQQAARARGLSLFPMLMAALQVALFAHTGRSRFCIGTVTANRRKREYEQCMGFFANTLALPADVQPDTGVMAMAESVAEVYRDATAHGDIDLAEVAGLFDLHRGGPSTTLVEVMFAYQSYPSLAARLEGLEHTLALKPFAAEPREGRFPLSLYLTPDADGLDGCWHYRTANFAPAEIEHIDRVFQAALLEIAAGGRQRVSALVRPAEAGSRPASGARQTAEPARIVERIAAFARSTPQAIALRAPPTSLSYVDLNGEITRLGSVLLRAGVGHGSRVGVLVPRDTHAVIAPLAIWFCGATYVPLDPDLPGARLSYMVNNAGIQSLLFSGATRKPAEQLAGSTAVGQLIDFDQAGDAGALRPACVAGSDCAYIIYTSGSTGAPKGVEISFANIDFYFAALSSALGLNGDDVYLLSASPSFSSSIRQWALPLHSGAGVFVAAKDDIRNAARLPRLVEQAGITVLDLVPSHWRNVLSAGGLSAPTTTSSPPRKLRLLLSASEALPVELAATIREAFPGARLVNMYGQTETAGIVLVNAGGRSAPGERYVSLGQPLPGNRVAIVDAQRAEVAPGAPGELIIIGPAVGLGYARGTANAGDRFCRYGGEPAYRSGDIVRADSSGDIHFVGRTDTQIKHRGFRIEPGDIESTARLHPAVRDAVASLTATDSDGERLQLHYTLEPAAAAEGHLLTGLKTLLAEHLPDYMLPAVYTQLEAMPLTHSGKVDRSALASGKARSADTPPAMAAGGHLAARLCAIWEHVLGAENIGPDDNFFDVGGNSLSSIDVVGRAREEGIALSLEQLFQYQTIKALAQVVEPLTGHEPRHAQSNSRPAQLPPQPTALQEAPPDQPPRYDVESLRQFSIEVLRKAGLAEEGVQILTNVQLESSLRGQATHNIGDIPRYAKRLSQGVLNGSPNIDVVDVTGFSAAIDGDNAPGQWVATVAMEKAIALAQTHGIGVVGVRRSNHYGAAGQYAWQATQAGFLGLCFTNGPVILAPTGSNEPLFGNNPLAVGIPREGSHPVILDMAMSVATRGKIGLTVAEGKPLDAGWILDSLGRPSTALEDLAAGLAAPIGGHKGYGLAFIIEILAGALTGSGYCADHRGKAAARHGGSDIGHLFITLKPELLMPAPRFLQRVEDIVAQTKSSRKVNGVDEIFIPGEIEMKAREQNLAAGIALHASALKRLRDYARRFDIQSKITRADGDQEAD